MATPATRLWKSGTMRRRDMPSSMVRRSGTSCARGTRPGLPRSTASSPSSTRNWSNGNASGLNCSTEKGASGGSSSM